jgi:hypothetical protein
MSIFKIKKIIDFCCVSMLYIIAGKVMSVLVLTIFFKSLNNFTELLLFENSLGWFLVEHIFEEYHLTAGKFFLINEDFRTLIRNSIAIVRNFLFLAQALNPLEFLLINLVLFLTFIFYTEKKFKNIIRFCVVICYFFLFQSFLLFNFYFFYVFLVNFLTFIFITITLIFYVYFFYLIISLSKQNNYNKFLKIIIVKSFIYSILVIGQVYIYISIIISTLKINNNIIHEILLTYLIPYIYVYVSVF